MATLIELINGSPSLSALEKEALIKHVPDLNDKQKNALVQVFEEEARKDKAAEESYRAAWQKFAHGMQNVAHDVEHKLS